MCILILINAYTLKNKIWNKYIRLELGVANIEDKMRENCLHCFSHVQRPKNALVRRIQGYTFEVFKMKKVSRRWLIGMKNIINNCNLLGHMSNKKAWIEEDINVDDHKINFVGYWFVLHIITSIK